MIYIDCRRFNILEVYDDCVVIDFLLTIIILYLEFLNSWQI